MKMHWAFHPADNIDYKCQGKKKEEDSPALRIALTHLYKNSENTLKRAKKDQLRQPVTEIAAYEQTEKPQKLENEIEKKNKRQTDEITYGKTGTWLKK